MIARMRGPPIRCGSRFRRGNPIEASGATGSRRAIEIRMGFKMIDITPERRREAARKGIETKRRKREQIERARLEALAYANGLRGEITALEIARRELIAETNACAGEGVPACRKSLLTASDIALAAKTVADYVGVYFLLSGDVVVYVGQSTNIHARVQKHRGERKKKFDRFAFIRCEYHELNVLESIYIHALRPMYNRSYPNGERQAPMHSDQIPNWSSLVAIPN